MSVWFRVIFGARLTCYSPMALLTFKLAVQIYETIQFLSPQDVVPQSVLLEASKRLNH